MTTVSASQAIRESLMRKSLASARHRAALGHLLGLAENDVLAIQHLARAGRLTPSRLAWLLGITSGGATALVQRLERDGHVEREPHPSDRRSSLVRLTAQIERRAARWFAPLVGEIDSAIAELSPDERRTVSAFVVRVAEATERSAEELARAANGEHQASYGLPDSRFFV
jgi:DNA-binding MarR family transcriptional regulator